MKEALITPILLVMLVYTSGAQSISEFLLLRQATTEQVFKKLENQNWYLYDEEEQRKEDMYVYTFKLADDVESMLGLQWIDYVYRPKHNNKNRISFQVQSYKLFEKYLKEILALGFVLELEKVYDNHIILVYRSEEVKIEVIESQNKYLYDGTKYYNFAFYNAMEYDAVFSKENEMYSTKIPNNLNTASVIYFK